MLNFKRLHKQLHRTLKQGKVFLILTAVFFAFSSCKKTKDNAAQDLITLYLLSLSSAMEDVFVFVSNDDTSKNTISTIRHSMSGNQFIGDLALSTVPGAMVATSRNRLYAVLRGENSVAVLDANQRPPVLIKKIHTGERSGHIYLDPDGRHIWVMNDGNYATGIDTDATNLDCSASSKASVTVIRDGETGAIADNAAVLVKNICVGKGHHKTGFSPKKAFISNIKDGSLTVINNDPASPGRFGASATISLCSQTGEDALSSGITCSGGTTPNSASPHGIGYSSATGKIYNSNSGYGSVVEIDPATNSITRTANTLFSNALMITPGQNFAIIKAVDNASDANHITGKITALRLSDMTFSTLDLPDANPDHFSFNHDGTKIYVTTSKGYGVSADQALNQKLDSLYAVSIASLPAAPLLIKEIKVGKTSDPHRSIGVISHDGMTMAVLVPNYDDGTVSVIDPMTESILQTITVGGKPDSMSVFMPGMGSGGH
ncbi:MAG: hypothetical protein OEZ34_10990 [Spirochaetia bacterium]|nr:hypothetical protein [Spirochaetia bacterium]